MLLLRVEANLPVFLACARVGPRVRCGVKNSKIEGLGEIMETPPQRSNEKSKPTPNHQNIKRRAVWHLQFTAATGEFNGVPLASRHSERRSLSCSWGAWHESVPQRRAGLMYCQAMRNVSSTVDYARSNHLTYRVRSTGREELPCLHLSIYYGCDVIQGNFVRVRAQHCCDMCCTGLQWQKRIASCILYLSIQAGDVHYLPFCLSSTEVPWDTL